MLDSRLWAEVEHRFERLALPRTVIHISLQKLPVSLVYSAQKKSRRKELAAPSHDRDESNFEGLEGLSLLLQ